MNCYSINTELNKINLPVELKENNRKMEEKILEIYPEREKHLFKGFGGALTDASCYTLSTLERNEREKVYDAFFNSSEPIYNYIRIPIDSCDFSLSQHQICHSLEDWKQRRFDFSVEEKYVFTYLDEIIRYADKNIPILFSPWSPASFFKENNNRLQGGHLKKEYYADWAEYISIFLNAFRKRGYNVWGLTVQNEPNAIQTWDSCLYTAEEESLFLTDYLKPTLGGYGLEGIKLFYWDHNKERLLSRAEAFLNKDTTKAVAGIAFHGYCGDHFESLEIYRRENPSHEMIMSEFCMSIKDRDDYKKQLNVYSHEYINDIACGADRIIDWNIVLEENGGPNHVGNYCLAPFMKNGNRVEKNMTYHVIAELAKAGNNAVVLQTSSFDKSMDCVAFMTTDKQINLVFKNTKKQRINVRLNDKVFSIVPDSNSLTVLSLKENDYE